MTSRVSYAPQDVQKMCKQAERDHESRKLMFLMDRVKRQIAERDGRGSQAQTSKMPAISESGIVRLPSRSVPLER